MDRLQGAHGTDRADGGSGVRRRGAGGHRGGVDGGGGGGREGTGALARQGAQHPEAIGEGPEVALAVDALALDARHLADAGPDPGEPGSATSEES